jgi:hypothetical protein
VRWNKPTVVGDNSNNNFPWNIKCSAAIFTKIRHCKYLQKDRLCVFCKVCNDDDDDSKVNKIITNNTTKNQPH